MNYKARFLLADMNLAMPMVHDSLRASGVDCVLLEYHVEVATAMSKDKVLSSVEDKDGNTHLLYDTVGIWALGPMGDFGCESASPWSHLLAGLCHPFPETKGINTRGFSAAHSWRGTLPLTEDEMTDDAVAFIMEVIDDINAIKRTRVVSNMPLELIDVVNIFQYYRDELPKKLRASGWETNAREKRGQGAGFG